ncbi:MAG: tetratricopeptide repeat protein [Pseudomonadota bacterium]
MQRIERIAGYIREAEGVCFIIGAGAPRSAGIPLASELVERICKDEKYAHCIDGLSEVDRKNYGKVMSRLTPAEREGLINPLLRDAQISWGQIALATMAQKGLITRILTFNFDLVLESAAAMLGLQLPVYDFAASPTSDIARIPRSAIIHLHGQGHGLVLLNSEDETKRHSEQIAPILADTVRNHVTIVAGYSGAADGALGVIEQEYNSRHKLIWLGFGENPPAHLRSLLEKDYAEYFESCNFDETMLEIANSLRIWPPTILENPLAHTLSILDRVAEFPIKDHSGLDALTRTKQKLEKESIDWEETRNPEDRAFDSLLRKQIDDESPESAFQNLDNLTEEAKEALAWAFISDGNVNLQEAKESSGDEGRARFEEALQRYSQALAIKPDKHEALYNWGNALSDQAKTLTGKEAQEKLEAASKKYEQALAINPDDHEALNNWGNALSGQAKTLTGKEAQEKLEAASKKYEEALSIKPDSHEALNNWGVALSDQAKALTGKEAQEKIEEAGKKYEQALAIKPDYLGALSNCVSTILTSIAMNLENKPAEECRRAEELARKAKSISGLGTYNLVCVLARTDRATDAISELEECHRDGTLPDVEHLSVDPDLEMIRNLPQFKALLETVKTEP